MIDGYTHLNASITKTLDLISNVETASKEQQDGIVQINDAINQLDQQTQQNANIASQTKDVAVQTDEIAKLVVSSADEKEFLGKDSVKAKNISSKSVSKSIKIQQANTSTPSKKNKQSVQQKQSTKAITPVVSNSSDDEWASF